MGHCRGNRVFLSPPVLPEMASWNSLLTEEQLWCPICLEVFTRPVSTPCGHNFCMSCIATCWKDTSSCQCPVCKDTFWVRPDLKVNTFISELAEHFRVDATGSCLQCLMSSCQRHLEPQRRRAAGPPPGSAPGGQRAPPPQHHLYAAGTQGHDRPDGAGLEQSSADDVGPG